MLKVYILKINHFSISHSAALWYGTYTSFNAIVSSGDIKYNPGPKIKNQMLFC